MALNATTLSAAVALNDTSLTVASATGIVAPNFQGAASNPPGTGTVVYLYVEQEWMQVTGVSGTNINVKRGMLGSCAAAHASATIVLAGLANDFPGPIPISIKAQQDFAPNFIGFSAPVAGANTNVATGPFFHLTGTVIMKTLTAPSSVLSLSGGEIGIVFDGSGAGLTWDATGNIAVAGTATTAGSLVFFIFDQGSAKWHPSRLA